MVTLNRGTVAKLVAIVIAVTLLVGATVWFRWPGRVQTIQQGCPGVVTGTNNGLADYALTIRWGQVTYYATEGDTDARLGRELLTVTCSIGEIEQSGGGLIAEPGPWPDGTSTGLPRGTTVHEVLGDESGCRLAARYDGAVVVFVPWRESGETSGPAC